MIYFLAQAGLCNRMRGISSAYQFAREMGGQPLTIIWADNHECNCALDKIFTIKADIPVHIINISYMRNFRMRRWKERAVIALIRQRCQEKFIDDDVYMDKEILLEKAGKARNTFITSAAYWLASEKLYEMFVPTENIQKMVANICSELGEYSVGVHLRRTDHVGSIENSTTSAFINWMNSEIAEKPKVKFYVASDDSTEKRHLKEIFGERIVMQENMELSRETEQGIIGAVTDLYALASTNKILASVGSSYSDVAAQIRGIQKVDVK